MKSLYQVIYTTVDPGYITDDAAYLVADNLQDAISIMLEKYPHVGKEDVKKAKVVSHNFILPANKPDTDSP